MVWECNGCDETNKPLSISVIEEKVKDVKCILSVYPEYTVLAFRFTATITNFFQDILWAIQVPMGSRRDKMRTHPPDAKCKGSSIACGTPSAAM
jgi:hypothetical protein